MSKSIIQELQIEATNPTVSASDLLRKAKIVAVKLDLKDFEEWIEKELSGYIDAKNSDLPSYRIVIGEPKAFNPYRGWQPILFSDELGEIMAKRGVSQPVGELDDLLKTSDGGTFMIDYSTTTKRQIMDSIGLETDIKFMLGRGAVAGILDAVRNQILDWALRLEKAGILGEGVSFSKEDKQKAQGASNTYNIGHIANFAGSIGDVSGSASVVVHQLNNESIKEIKGLIDQIKKYSGEIPFDSANKELVERQIVELDQVIKKEKVDSPKVFKLLTSLRSIFEGATGNVVAQGILYSLSKFVS